MSIRIFSVLFIVVMLLGCAGMNTDCAKKTNIWEIARDKRFIAYSDGTVFDKRTNLMWAAKDNGSDINWAAAKVYCENYRGGGYNDWRMPTLDELEELYDERNPRPAKCSDGDNIRFATGLIDISCFYLWASETSVTTNESAIFSFGAGIRTAFTSRFNHFGRVLPVRSLEGLYLVIPE